MTPPKEETRETDYSESDDENLRFTYVGQETNVQPILRTKYSRSVTKSGQCAMRKKSRVGKFDYYTTDVFTSLIDSRWRWILFIFSMSFMVSWFIFGIFWWLIAYAHNDLTSSTNPTITNERMCVERVTGFTAAFLFSLETQYTTGYGTRSPTDECPEAVFVLCVQSIFGMLLQCILVGVVFAKVSKPKKRKTALRFSEKAVVCMRDGVLHMMFRLADVRKSHLFGCKVHAWVLQHRVTPEGEVLPNYQRRLKVSIDEGGPNLFLLWPVTVVHRIDSNSPFYDLCALGLFSAEFEVVLSIVCATDSTGATTEALRSYTHSEILWGHRFQTIVKREQNGLQVDYALFDKTATVDTPLCSARQLNDLSEAKEPVLNPFPNTPLAKIFPTSQWKHGKQVSVTDTV